MIENFGNLSRVRKNFTNKIINKVLALINREIKNGRSILAMYYFTLLNTEKSKSKPYHQYKIASSSKTCVLIQHSINQQMDKIRG